ncbi:hypothetical protein BDW71DRAFT_200450 [Aspergillus fruticulosus]
MATLQTLDFSKYLYGTDAERTQLCYDLVASFKQHGFAKLINHGIPDGQVQELFDWSAKMFNLPLKDKLAMANVPDDAPQRGWSRQGAETTAYLRQKVNTNEKLSDEKEHWDCSSADDTEFPNQWPSDSALPGFRPFVEKTFVDLQQASLQIMAAMEIGLDLPRGTFVDQCKVTASELRLNHYPEVSLSKLREGKTKRGWPHADFGLITFVFQDGVGGLEMEDRSNPGTFVPVPPGAPGGKTELAINISETFQRWTNDVIPAGIHQVAPPAEMLEMEDGTVPERYSNIFFFKASKNAIASPLPEFVTEGNPARYKPMTALQFQKARTMYLHSLHRAADQVTQTA